MAVPCRGMAVPWHGIHILWHGTEIYIVCTNNIFYWTFASLENSVVKGVKKFLQASGKAERSQML